MSVEIPQFEQSREKLYITQPCFYSMGLDLAGKVEAYQDESGVKFDTLVGAPRGSLELMSILSQHLGLKGQQVQSINVNTRDDDGTQSETKTGQIPETAKIEGMNCLWADDVRDTGMTEDAAEKILYSLGAKSVMRADLGYKPSQDKAEPKRAPDFYIFETAKWIVFPWERIAEYKQAQEMLRTNATSPHELKRSLMQLKSNFMRAQGFSSLPIITASSSGIAQY